MEQLDLTAVDLQDLAKRGIAVETIRQQLRLFKRGTPYVQLKRACTVYDGILRLSEAAVTEYAERFRHVVQQGRVLKFVPASGAATRMFKSLIAALNDDAAPDWDTLAKQAVQGKESWRDVRHFIENLSRFAFYPELRGHFSKRGVDLQALAARGEYQPILSALLTETGLNYANLPKGMIAFHRYPDGSRTAFDEHLAEAVRYAADAESLARVHFTVPDDEALQQVIRDHVDEASRRYAAAGIHFEIAYSCQKPSTDTLAVDLDNRPFRNADGRLLFRPGGHGALLENLNDLKADIVFIKNIDNVVPDDRKSDTVRYKMALGGYLADLQARIFGFLEALDAGSIDAERLWAIRTFVETQLSIRMPEKVEKGSRAEQVDFLFKRLNRPLRVCGMVKNQGEPGGGPFWVEDRKGNVSLQVVETAQINVRNPNQQRILASATHFSPVDFICGVRDFRGQPFDLHDYRDSDSVFIAKKSSNGRNLKALELPGLWNGGMAYWNSVFVEVPVSTFNPVKTVFDLLRPAHQPL